MSMISGFSTALSGMKTAQSQLEIISSNIANVDTPGYTRKTAQQNSVVLAGSTAGVKLGNIERTVSESLLKSYLASNSEVGAISVTSDYLGQLQSSLGTPESENSIAMNISDLQAAFNSFAVDVTSASGRYSLLTTAETLTARLNSLTSTIQKLRGDADVQIAADVETVNGLLDEIDDLNERIVKETVLNSTTVADLEDKRDQALRELSGYMDINYFKRESGEIVIQTKQGVMLLDKDPHYLSHNAITQSGATNSYYEGAIDGIFVDGEDITGKITGGEIAGLIEVRDETLTSLQSQLDELAGVIKNEINQAHNRGTAYPNTPSELTGSRDFIDSAVQQIKIESGDVRFTIFDEEGNQISTASLIGDMGFPRGGGTIDDMMQSINDWLRSPDGANLPQASAGVDQDGKVFINTGDSRYTLSIMDETTSTPGSGQQDAKIRFDVNGDGVYDRSAEGFSNFLGLNDFFSSSQNEAVYDSKVLAKTANLGVQEKVTLNFAIDGQGALGSINIYPSDSLEDIVNKINSNPALNTEIKASLVPNGNGYMLRINNMSGSQMEINETPRADGTTSGFIDRLGIKPSNAGASGSLSVRSDISSTPGLIAAGSPSFDASSGKYVLNAAANNIANDMGNIFSDTHTFEQAGNIASTTTTLANYASTFVGSIATKISDANAALEYQQELNNSIADKEAEMSGVDLDEELGQLIIFQKSYAACAQTFTASKEMLDILLGMMQ